MTTSSAVGISSASSSLSPRGVRMSWLPTTTSVGTSIVPSRSAIVSSAARMASTWAAKAWAGRPNASGPSQPTAGIRRRNERGPMTQRAALLVIAPIPCSRAAAPHPASSSRRHSWLRHDVHVSVSERTRSGYGDGEDLADRPAHRRPDDVGGVDAGVVEHGDGVGRHLLERVGAVRLVAATGAAVVEGDRAVGPRQGQPLQVPAVLVGAEALDQQHRRAAAAAGDLVVDAGAVGRRRVRHVSSRPSRDSGSQSSGVPVWVPPNSSSSRWMRCSTWSASSSSISGPRRRRPGRIAGPISMRADRPTASSPWPPGTPPARVATAAPIERVVDAPDAAGVQRRRRRHHEQLAGPQRAGDLVGPGQQPTEAPGQGPDRRDVGPSDEAGGATGLAGDGEGGLDRGQRRTGGC